MNEEKPTMEMGALPVVAVTAGCSLIVLGLIAENWALLPEPMAIHFGLDGPDGAMSRGGFTLFILSLCWLPMGFTLLGGRSNRWRSFSATLPVVSGVGVMAVGVSLQVVTANRGREVWTDATGPSALSVAILFLASIIATLVGWRVYSARTAGLATMYQVRSGALGRDERAVWVGSASNRGLDILAVLAVFPAVGMYWWFSAHSVSQWVLWSVVAPLALVPLLLKLFAHVVVVVDGRGLSVRFGGIDWLGKRIALKRIAQASVEEVIPLEHGGWGYRGNLWLLKWASVVVRAGKALRIDLVDGRRFWVTVDDASSGATLLNGLIQQEAANGDQSATP